MLQSHAAQLAEGIRTRLRAVSTSSSSRVPAPSPARKNLRRSAPVTSTWSSTDQAATLRRQRLLHATQSTQSDPWLDPAVIAVRARGTLSRNVVITAPLGSSRSTGAEQTRPRSWTVLSSVSPSSSVVFSPMSDRLHEQRAGHRAVVGGRRRSLCTTAGGQRRWTRSGSAGRAALELRDPFGGVGDLVPVHGDGAVEPLDGVLGASSGQQGVGVRV